MKKIPFLVKIDRGNPTDRPLESFLDINNIHPTLSIPLYLTQDPTKDSYIIKFAEEQFLLQELLDDEPASPLKRRRDIQGRLQDSLIIWKYPQAEKLTFATELREGSVAQVHSTQGITEYDTYEEAKTFVETLPHDDEWIIFDESQLETPVGERTQPMWSRPSLVEEDEIGSRVFYKKDKQV